MRAEERQHRILVRARQDGRVKVASAAEDLGVALETIRRDLSELERRGLVRRVHGGAYPVQNAAFETDPSRRATLHIEAKHRIAAEAVKLLGEAETLFVDEGYTSHILAALLPTDRPLTVVTTSLSTAAAISDSTSTTVLLLGGRIRPRTLATVGRWTCSMLAGFVIDLAFLGSSGISRAVGLTATDTVVADVKARAVEVSRRRVFLGHHSKFGVSSFCRFADVGDFEAIVTDTGLPGAEAGRYSQLGPHVHRV